MFRKGTVTFFDNDLGQGLIELNDNHQQVVFKLEDFSNQSILPQIGERIKCVVLEQYGATLAKFIVRFDYKNYANDQNKLPITRLHSENGYEQIRNIRKALKKRRLVADNDLANIKTQTQTEQLVSVEAIPAIDLVVEGQQVIFVEPIQTLISNPMIEEGSINLYQNNQIELVAQTQVDLSIKVIQNTESEDEIHTVNNIKTTEGINVVMLSDLGGAYQNIEISGGSKKQELVKPVEMLVEGQCFKEQDLYFDRQMNQQLLEKNMRLTAIQSLIQKLKVKFLYSKRKQPIKKIRLEKRLALNPWVVTVAVVIFIGVSSVMYARDRYKQYKIETEMRFQQYQQQQKDKIKQQKRKAYSH